MHLCLRGKPSWVVAGKDRHEATYFQGHQWQPDISDIQFNPPHPHTLLFYYE